MAFPLSRASEIVLHFRLLECDRCNERTWLTNTAAPERSATCDRHVWWEQHTFLAERVARELWPVPVGGVGG